MNWTVNDIRTRPFTFEEEQNLSRRLSVHNVYQQLLKHPLIGNYDNESVHSISSSSSSSISNDNAGALPNRSS